MSSSQATFMDTLIRQASASSSDARKEDDQIYSLEDAISDCQWFAVTLTGNMKFQHISNDPTDLTETFCQVLREYKNDREDSFRNRNKPISDLLVSALETVALQLKTTNVSPASYRFVTKEQALSRIQGIVDNNPGMQSGASSESQFTGFIAATNATVDVNEGMALISKLLTLIIAILYAEKTLGVDRLSRSEFVKTMLLNLQTILLNQPSQKLKGKVRNDLIGTIISYLERYALAFAKYAKMYSVNSQKNHAIFTHAVLQLVDYIIIKQTDSKHNVAKTDKAKSILLQLFQSETAENYVTLFNLIAEGIQLSRKEGKDGEKSRGLEYVLVKLRDYLVKRLFSSMNSNAVRIGFSQKDLEAILESVSYCIHSTAETPIGDKKVVDADVSPYTLLVIAAMRNTLNPNAIIALQLKHCQRLLTQIPREVNFKADVNLSSYLFNAGSHWPRLMIQLLQSNSLDWEQREEMQRCALIWNYRMMQCNEFDDGSNNPTYIHYLVPISLLGAVIDHGNSAVFPPDLMNSSKNSWLDRMFRKMQQCYGELERLRYESEAKLAKVSSSGHGFNAGNAVESEAAASSVDMKGKAVSPRGLNS